MFYWKILLRCFLLLHIHFLQCHLQIIIQKACFTFIFMLVKGFTGALSCNGFQLPRLSTVLIEFWLVKRMKCRILCFFVVHFVTVYLQLDRCTSITFRFILAFYVLGHFRFTRYRTQFTCSIWLRRIFIVWIERWCTDFASIFDFR